MFKDLEIVLHAFLASCLGYFNSLHAGVRQASLSSLQKKNVTARFLTGTKIRNSISPVVASLHWLPAKYRIDLDILLFVFRALHGGPQYISDKMTPYTSGSALRSSNKF